MCQMSLLRRSVATDYACAPLTPHLAKLPQVASWNVAPESLLDVPTAKMALAQKSVAMRAGSRRPVKVRASAEPATVQAPPARVVVKAHGAYTVKGTVRKINEDRFDVKASFVFVRGSSFPACVPALVRA